MSSKNRDHVRQPEKGSQGEGEVAVECNICGIKEPAQIRTESVGSFQGGSLKKTICGDCGEVIDVILKQSPTGMVPESPE
ncbi:MAG: hypothetical protein ABEK59_03020 [Halobacteria archaeon]